MCFCYHELTKYFIFLLYKQLSWLEGWGVGGGVPVRNSIVICGTMENGVINYPVSAGLRKEASLINSKCLSFTTEAESPHAHLIKPSDLAAENPDSLHRTFFSALPLI